MILVRYVGLHSDRRTWTCLFQLLADGCPLQARRFLRLFAKQGKEQGQQLFLSGNPDTNTDSLGSYLRLKKICVAPL